MHVYNDIDQFVNAISMIDDSDSPTATNFNTPNEALADRTRFLLSSSGAYPLWVVGADADTTYTRQRRRTVIRVGALGLTADRIYTISDTSAVAGDIFEIVNNDGVFNVIVRNTTDYLATLGVTFGSNVGALQAGDRRGVFIYTGAQWEVLYTNQSSLQVFGFGASGGFLVPSNYTGIMITIGCGGGGGGGGGAGQDSAVDNYATGGGGGAAGLQGISVMYVFAGDSLTIAMGDGGTGGVGGATGTNGTEGVKGSDTIVSLGVTTLSRFRGGNGGFGGIRTIKLGTSVSFAPGGASGDFAFSPSLSATMTLANVSNIPLSPGDGGPGVPNYFTTKSGDGARQIQTLGFARGIGGNHGGDDSTSRGGGGGGGGAEGAYGSGGDGGAGGGAVAAGPASGGGPGSSTAANSGGGGGGGGGGGAGSGGSTGGNGGTGGSGRLLIIIPR